jgi:hypothetical protein
LITFRGEQAGTFVKLVTTVVSVVVRQCPLVSVGDHSSTTHGDQAIWAVAERLTRV